MDTILDRLQSGLDRLPVEQKRMLSYSSLKGMAGVSKTSTAEDRTALDEAIEILIKRGALHKGAMFSDHDDEEYELDADALVEIAQFHRFTHPRTGLAVSADEVEFFYYVEEADA